MASNTDLINLHGLAAADELSALLSADDFEPAHDVDTEALDTVLDALRGAQVLVTRLDALRAHLASGVHDDAAREGLAVEVRMTIERLDAITAWAL